MREFKDIFHAELYYLINHYYNVWRSDQFVNNEPFKSEFDEILQKMLNEYPIFNGLSFDKLKDMALNYIQHIISIKKNNIFQPDNVYDDFYKKLNLNK